MHPCTMFPHVTNSSSIFFYVGLHAILKYKLPIPIPVTAWATDNTNQSSGFAKVVWDRLQEKSYSQFWTTHHRRTCLTKKKNNFVCQAYLISSNFKVVGPRMSYSVVTAPYALQISYTRFIEIQEQPKTIT